MKIKSKKLPKTERFACSENDVKKEFSGSQLTEADFGYYSKTLFFEKNPKPRIKGKIIAYLTVTTLRHSSLTLYPIKCADYSDQASNDFKNTILPEMRDWLAGLYQSTETNKRWGFVVEWTNNDHHCHKGNYY